MILLCRQKIRRNKLLICFMLVSIFVIWIVIYVQQVAVAIRCSEKDSLNIINTTCKWYNEGYIVGSLCPLLCGDEKKVHYKHCINYKSGKTVLITTCKDACEPEITIPAILKSRFPDIDDFTKRFLGGNRDSISSISSLRSMLLDTIWTNLGINMSKSEDIIKTIFEEDYTKYIKTSDQRSYRALSITVWSLAQQQEYLITKLNQDNALFPKIYHSCGSIYLMESSPPGDILDPALLPWKSKKILWKDRAETALKLLDAMSIMESGFHQTLHMCDLKGENFGVGMDGVIKLIDTDSVFFHDQLARELITTETCRKHSDCNFWDCHGVCGDDGKCKKERLNNNLQSLCEDVFSSSYPAYNNGLLKSPPKSIATDLEATLKECVRPQVQDEKTTQVIYHRLYKLLQSSFADSFDY
ncbi:hypothetical protein SNE40_007687 [Patella caerulea]|uniref:FAM69 N-terminal domain-containing protein n=2 Tax=Patella caerulea TaxID=87958 RepID=A0AAN8PVD9_PATCE